MKLKHYLNEEQDIIKEVIKFFKSQRTWFQTDSPDKKSVLFISRDNGSVGDEEPGKKDFKEAQRLAKLIKKKFGNTVDIDIDSVDEWVHLEVTAK